MLFRLIFSSFSREDRQLYFYFLVLTFLFKSLNNDCLLFLFTIEIGSRSLYPERLDTCAMYSSTNNFLNLKLLNKRRQETKK